MTSGHSVEGSSSKTGVLVPNSAPADVLGIDGELKPRADSRKARRLRGLARNPVALSSLIVLVGLAIAGILAPWIAPHDVLTQDLANRRLPPLSPDHILGTDSLGRDVLSRLLYGAGVAIKAAVVSVGIGVILGVVPALYAGYMGGWSDSIASRLADALLSFPPLLLAMAIVGVMGPSLVNAMIAIGIVFAPRFYRIVRSAVLAVRAEAYIEASLSIGTATSYIVRRHVLPNVLSPLIVEISLACGYAILAEASLGYLALGVTPPNPSWGGMLADGQEALYFTPWLTVIPSVVIVISVLACNLLGDSIRDEVGRMGGTAR